jgi:DNA gyrase subunit A
MGRNTQGVIMIRLSKQERLIGIERVESLDGNGEGDDEEIDIDADTESPDAP